MARPRWAPWDSEGLGSGRMSGLTVSPTRARPGSPRRAQTERPSQVPAMPRPRPCGLPTLTGSQGHWPGAARPALSLLRRGGREGSGKPVLPTVHPPPVDVGRKLPSAASSPSPLHTEPRLHQWRPVPDSASEPSREAPAHDREASQVRTQSVGQCQLPALKGEWGCRGAEHRNSAQITWGPASGTVTTVGGWLEGTGSAPHALKALGPLAPTNQHPAQGPAPALRVDGRTRDPGEQLRASDRDHTTGQEREKPQHGPLPAHGQVSEKRLPDLSTGPSVPTSHVEDVPRPGIWLRPREPLLNKASPTQAKQPQASGTGLKRRCVVSASTAG